MYIKSNTVVSIKRWLAASTVVHRPPVATSHQKEMTMPDFTADLSKAAQDLANAAKDVTYVVIGVGVLGYQKAQVQRREILKRLSDPKAGIEGRIQGVRTDLSGAMQAVDAKVEDLIAKVEAAFVPIEDRLPGQARDLAKQVQVQAREARRQIRDRILTVAG
jgi:hypothetical protein